MDLVTLMILVAAIGASMYYLWNRQQTRRIITTKEEEDPADKEEGNEGPAKP